MTLSWVFVAYLLFFYSLISFLSFFSCSEGKYKKEKVSRVSTCCVGKDGRIKCPPPDDGCVDWLPYMKDERGRYVFFHGVNVSGSTKNPTNEDPCSFEIVGNGGIPTYVGKPFPPEQADKFFSQLKNLGFNIIRFLIAWEGVMPESPEKIDREYLSYLRKIVEKAWEYDIYVLLDFHQDAFSRHFIARFNDLESVFIKFDNLLKLIAGGAEIAGFDASVTDMIARLLGLFPVSGENVCMGEKIDNLPYNNAVKGDGAPRWAVQLALPHKDLNSKWWGYPRIILNLRKVFADPVIFSKLKRVAKRLAGVDETMLDSISGFVLGRIPEVEGDIFSQTSDFLPWTNWGVGIVTSIDVQRAFAVFFSGRDTFPGLRCDNENIPCYGYEPGTHVQDILQDSYARAWQEVAKAVKGLPNVVGYDIMNEPVGQFILLTLFAAMFQAGSTDTVTNFIELILGDREIAEDIRDILITLEFIPRNTSDEEKKRWGFDTANLLALANINFGFDRNYMLPFLERIGKAIEEVDPDAVIWVEHALGTIEWSLSFFTGGELGVFAFLLPRPRLKQVVFAPHWYPDIYPFVGFNVQMRTFEIKEKRGKDYTKGIKNAIHLAKSFMGNVPVVLGEFGTYFPITSKPLNNQESINLRTRFEEIMEAKKEGYIIPKYILQNYYKAIDKLFLNHIQWCWSWENTPWRGENWNSENFSIVEPITEEECRKINCRKFPHNLTIVPLPSNSLMYEKGYRYLAPRAHEVYSRPFPRFMSGKPKKMELKSLLEYFDPAKGIVNRAGEFILEFESKETDEPTEIFIPYYIYYPNGFYVWLSDGYAIYDHKNFMLYWYPEEDKPGHIHKIVIRGPLEGQENTDWDYFFKEDIVITRKGG